ncbi:hypothetical protein P872_14815 [Rhodonellum psychrophilum GCM71 = DSM 17998]|uniref:Uncharacterized protein n=1 Tax=Rhodonellum psychrophilum GCM71 = DSM 17998 TaxID=1123057 RepID=U5BUL3_9BACT|nr:hypothetical protein P872_14815 [Rhodonellum psychrophilum GCM71 = DSM 17998]
MKNRGFMPFEILIKFKSINSQIYWIYGFYKKK